MTFINENFILTNDIAQELYHNYAKKQPIIDYHCHLSPKEIAENKPFNNIFDIWLAGDHYKWRAMRANGVSEDKITGTASAQEKFKAWAETVESCVGNPLYHWSHLELKNYFNIDEVLTSKNYKQIWELCNAQMQQGNFTPQNLIAQSNVESLCTTDSPTDSLEYHDAIKQQSDFKTKVLPTFRPDDALDSEGETFINFINRLTELTHIKITSFENYIEALNNRIEYFHSKGCRLSDHGFTQIEYSPASKGELIAIFNKKLSSLTLNDKERSQYRTAVFHQLCKRYKANNWVTQIHFGVIRNNNTIMLKQLGINTGFDSIYDQTHLATNLNRLFDTLNQDDALPQTIIYNLNPKDNDVVASTIANFQKAGVKSYIQFGSGWWFSDTKRGMLRQLTTLADHGLIMNFVGMLTDSRSFISYTRHEYFRRICCNYIGELVTKGEIPNDKLLLEKLITGICYKNAADYFSF